MHCGLSGLTLPAAEPPAEHAANGDTAEPAPPGRGQPGGSVAAVLPAAEQWAGAAAESAAPVAGGAGSWEAAGRPAAQSSSSSGPESADKIARPPPPTNRAVLTGEVETPERPKGRHWSPTAGILEFDAAGQQGGAAGSSEWLSEWPDDLLVAVVAGGLGSDRAPPGVPYSVAGGGPESPAPPAVAAAAAAAGGGGTAPADPHHVAGPP